MLTVEANPAHTEVTSTTYTMQQIKITNSKCKKCISEDHTKAVKHNLINFKQKIFLVYIKVFSNYQKHTETELLKTKPVQVSRCHLHFNSNTLIIFIGVFLFLFFFFLIRLHNVGLLSPSQHKIMGLAQCFSNIFSLILFVISSLLSLSPCGLYSFVSSLKCLPEMPLC